MREKKKVAADIRKYGKDKALKGMTFLGWFFYYTGTTRLYLDYQVWKPHFNWWHPFTWICILFAGVINFFHGIVQAIKAMFPARGKKVLWLKDAPKEASKEWGVLNSDK